MGAECGSPARSDLCGGPPARAVPTAITERDILLAAASWFELDADLRHGVEHDEFSLVYQPVFELATMAVSGVEALLRWHHPSRGVIAPGEFISHLEESRLIVDVGRFVLDEALRQGSLWRSSGLSLQVSVNVSARQLETDEIVTDIEAALEAHGFPAEALCIEVTETAVMEHFDQALLRLQSVRSLGVRIAIDDFGTGYSSLAHLQRLPVDILKIDQSFVQSLGHQRSSETFVHAQLQLAQALEIETVAEGVEEDHQLGFLRENHCVGAQGYLLCRPVEVTAIGPFVQNWKHCAIEGIGVRRPAHRSSWRSWRGHSLWTRPINLRRLSRH